MENTVIIKCVKNIVNVDKYALDSYNNKIKRYYNPTNKDVQKMDENAIGIDSLILLIVYENINLKSAVEMFIGEIVDIGQNGNIGYMMKVHLDRTLHERAIDSIIDKIDLDADIDFELGEYMMESKMQNLYQELKERILTKSGPINFGVCGRFEKQNYELKPWAQSDDQVVRVFSCSLNCDSKSEYQLDRENIVNSKAFRRLVDKAQIFSADKGDYFRTRMTHSLEVNQIAKAISYALGLNLDLTEAIALGHDLGHTPFGHQGERTLDDILTGKIDIDMKVSENLLKNRCFGGFKHNYQSAKILTELEECYVDCPGLNVSVQVVEGVLKHTKLKEEIDIHDFISDEYLQEMCYDASPICSCLEGQVVEIADEIAQRGHDVDDALTSGVISLDELMDRLQSNKCIGLRQRIERVIDNAKKTRYPIVDQKELIIANIVSEIKLYFINSAIQCSKENLNKKIGNEKITFHNKDKIIAFTKMDEATNKYLDKIVQNKVICNYEVARADYNANTIVRELFEKYYHNPRLLHYGTIHRIFLETLKNPNSIVSGSAINLNDSKMKIVNQEIEEITKTPLDNDNLLNYIKCKDKTDGLTNREIVIFEKRKILVRAITDYIAGMTDGYACAEFEKLK